MKALKTRSFVSDTIRIDLKTETLTSWNEHLIIAKESPELTGDTIIYLGSILEKC